MLHGRLLCGEDRLRKLDQKLVTAVRGTRTPEVIAAARAVSALAEPAFTSVVVAVFAARNARRAGWRAAATPCLVVASGMVVRRKVSQLIARPRPPATGWLSEPEGFSFPSKHTTLAALTAGVCAAGAPGLPRHGVPLLAAGVTGASRVVLGVHWPTDVLGGWLFAAGWLGLTDALVGAGRRRRPASVSHMTRMSKETRLWACLTASSCAVRRLLSGRRRSC